MDQSRREVLRVGAGLAGAGLLSGLAGCGEVSNVIDGGGSASAYYRDWLVAPDEIEMGDHYSYFSMRPSDMDGDEELSDTDAFDLLEEYVESDSALGPTGVNFDDIDELTSIESRILIAEGSFTLEDMVDELEDEDYDQEEELDSGSQIFLNGSAGKAFGVSSGTIVAASGSLSMPSEGAQPPSPPSDGDTVTENVRSISYGETVTGRVTEDDPEGDRGPQEPITFQGSEGDVITIHMLADEDTFLYLQDPDGNLVARNDDGGSGYNSSITTYTLQSSGEYTVLATSYSDSYYTTEYTYRLSLDLLYSPDELVDTVETVIGVQNGDTESYEAANEYAGPLFDAVGGGVLATGQTYEQEEDDNPENGVLEDSVGKGLSFSLAGDGEFNVTGAVVYEDEGDVDDGDIEDWADEGTGLANEELDDISTSTNGNVGTFSGVCDVDELFSDSSNVSL